MRLVLKDVEFDYVVLDEAQAVKNAGTESSRAVRLLRARQRLALSGTPVENHLGEFWTPLEFLNPGMLGAASAFQLAGGAMRNPSESPPGSSRMRCAPSFFAAQSARWPANCHRRRNKRSFAKWSRDSESSTPISVSTIATLCSAQVERAGMAKSKIHVLEALLRLRQAACHPGLLDEERAHEPSAKLDVLLDNARSIGRRT